MSVKEKIWTVILYVVTVGYLAFCCLILGWLLATENSSIEALVEFGGTYGTLLTGIPVLIAVLFAKQQIESSKSASQANIRMANLRRTLLTQQIKVKFRNIINLCEENDVDKKALTLTTEDEYSTFITQLDNIVLINLKAVESGYAIAYQAELAGIPSVIYEDMYTVCKAHAEKMLIRLDELESTISDYLTV